MQKITLADGTILDYSVIDKQHALMHEALHELGQAKACGYSSNIVESLMHKLKNVSMQHFALEKQLMDAIQYQHKEAHMQAHKDFLTSLDRLIDDYDAGKKNLSQDLLKLLVQWMDTHQIKDDQRLEDAIEKVVNP